MNNIQFKASVKREWLELCRSHKLTIYLALAVGFYIINCLLALFGQTINRYDFITGYNSAILVIYLVVTVFLIRNSVTKEMAEKKMVLPYSMGLKPWINLVSKYVVQLLIPTFIAFIMSFINGCSALLFFSEPSYFLAGVGQIEVGMVKIALSSVSILVAVLFYTLLNLSLSALTKSQTLSLIITLAVLIFGTMLTESINITLFTPNMIYQYAVRLYTRATNYQIVFSSLITLSILALLSIASVMVYNDRHDLAYKSVN